jgi:hypothetical protein
MERGACGRLPCKAISCEGVPCTYGVCVTLRHLTHAIAAETLSSVIPSAHGGAWLQGCICVRVVAEKRVDYTSGRGATR